MGFYGAMTPMIKDSSGVFLKCEFLHPGRSHKARVARHLVDDAEARGYIGGDSKRILLERTGGNLGVGLAMEARARGFPLTLVTDPSYSAAKRSLARRFGAIVLDRALSFPGCRDNGEAINEILRREGDRYHYLDQFGNPANPLTHESQTGPEIAEQLASFGVESDATVVLVCGMGTGATMRGVSAALAQRFARVRKVAVQPPNCELRSGRYAPHPFEGIAVGEPAPFVDVAELDDVVPVTVQQAARAHDYLITRHRFDVGPSSLANVAAVLSMSGLNDRHVGHQDAARDGHADQVFVTLLFDRGEDYASETGLG
jgi:cysteine synthase